MPDATTDPELESVAWDLDPLLDDGGGDPGSAVDSMLAAAQERADKLAADHAGKVDQLDGPGLVAFMRELAEIQELAGRAGSYAVLNFSINTADPARGALLQRMQELGTAIETALLFFELEWAALEDERAEELLATDGLEFARHHLRDRPPLPPAPAHRAGGADHDRAVADRPHGLDAAVRGAGVLDLRRAAGRHRARLARGRDGAPVLARPRGPARHRRARHRRAAARAAHARLRLQHPAGRQDGRGPAAQVPALAGQPQPRQRGLRRVGRGAGDRRPEPLRAAAPLVPPEGEAARARPAGRLRPAGRGHAGGRAGRLERGQGPGARLLRLVLRRARRHHAALLRRALDRRAGAPEQARRRVLRLHGALGAPVRDAQLHVQAPRRADARPRAGPRRPRRARREPGRLPHGHAADAGRDRERVRRADRLRPPARAGLHAGLAPRAAGRARRRRGGDRVPPGGDEPLRAPRAHRAPRAPASSPSTASASCGRSPRASCWATPSS